MGAPAFSAKFLTFATIAASLALGPAIATSFAAQEGLLKRCFKTALETILIPPAKPAKVNRYPTIPMNPQYRGEDRLLGTLVGRQLAKAKYFKPEEAAKYKVTFKNGLAYDASGNLLNTDKPALVILKPDGEILVVKDHAIGRIHHSSAVAGGEVASAGMTEAINGRFLRIDNASGHYTPGDATLEHVAAELYRQGVDTASIFFEGRTSHYRFPHLWPNPDLKPKPILPGALEGRAAVDELARGDWQGIWLDSASGKTWIENSQALVGKVIGEVGGALGEPKTFVRHGRVRALKGGPDAWVAEVELAGGGIREVFLSDKLAGTKFFLHREESSLKRIPASAGFPVRSIGTKLTVNNMHHLMSLEDATELIRGAATRSTWVNFGKVDLANEVMGQGFEKAAGRKVFGKFDDKGSVTIFAGELKEVRDAGEGFELEILSVEGKTQTIRAKPDHFEIYIEPGFRTRRRSDGPPIAHAPPRLKPIPRTPGIDLLQHELKSSGFFLVRKNDLADVKDGDYLFLIDSRGRKIYSLRTPDLRPDREGRHLATHRSLETRLRQLDGIDFEIVAAGEFRVRNGRVSELNNRSGTYRGDKASLEYSESALGAHGLQVEKGTKRRDFATETPDLSHLSALQASELTMKYAGTPEFERVTRLSRRLAERYPHPEIPGHFDMDRVVKYIQVELERVIETGTNDEVNLLSSSTFMLSYLHGEDALMVLHQNERVGKYTIEQIATEIERLVPMTR